MLTKNCSEKSSVKIVFDQFKKKNCINLQLKNKKKKTTIIVCIVSFLNLCPIIWISVLENIIMTNISLYYLTVFFVLRFFSFSTLCITNYLVSNFWEILRVQNIIHSYESENNIRWRFSMREKITTPREFHVRDNGAPINNPLIRPVSLTGHDRSILAAEYALYYPKVHRDYCYFSRR